MTSDDLAKRRKLLSYRLFCYLAILLYTRHRLLSRLCVVFPFSEPCNPILSTEAAFSWVLLDVASCLVLLSFLNSVADEQPLFQ